MRFGKRTLGSMAVGAGLVVAVAAPAWADDESGLEGLEISVVGNGTYVSDDDDAFQARHGLPASEISGGIERLFLERFMGDATLTVQGRAIVDNGDYVLKVDLEQEDLGFVRTGFDQSRTWYDGSGGFFPMSGGRFFTNIFGEEHALDRGDAYFETGLLLPDLPQLRLAYHYKYRDGSKDSLVRAGADTEFYGVKNFAPAERGIDEGSHIVTVDVEHTLAESHRLGAGFRYESTDIDNDLAYLQRPGEAGLSRYLTQRDSNDVEAITARAFTEHRFLDNALVLSTGYSYSDVEADVSGWRVRGSSKGASYSSTYTNRQAFDTGFLDLDGNTELERHKGQVSAMYRPIEALSIRAGFRVEQEDINGHSYHSRTTVEDAVGLPVDMTALGSENDTDSTSFGEDVELRFTGIRNVVLWARGEWEQIDGSIYEMESNFDAFSVDLLRDSDFDTDDQAYSVGATFYPLRRLNFSTLYEYSLRENDWDHNVDSTSNDNGDVNDVGSLDRYPAYLVSEDTEQHRFGFRATLRAAEGVRLVGRYDLRLATIDTMADELAELETYDVASHAIGTTINWNPCEQTWVQGDLGYTMNESDTPADDIVGAGAGTVTDFDSDYWSARLAAGAALSDALDLEAAYTLYLSDNYNNNAPVSQPYGAETTEHTVSVGLGYRLNENMKLGLRYAFVHSDDKTDGPQNDYIGNLIQTRLEVGF